MNKNYQDINAETIDRWIEEGWEWGKPVNHETYINAKNGKWNVLLTPVKFVPHEWFGEMKGKKLLGLASGGGQQIPIFSALGAECTVLDYSDRQLKSEEEVSKREGYQVESQINAVEGGFKLDANFTFSCQAEVVIFQLGTRAI